MPALIGGGASIAVALIFGLIGESKFQNAVSGYNVDLKTALKLERMSFYIKPEHRNYAWVDSRF